MFICIFDLMACVTLESSHVPFCVNCLKCGRGLFQHILILIVLLWLMCTMQRKVHNVLITTHTSAHWTNNKHWVLYNNNSVVFSIVWSVHYYLCYCISDWITHRLSVFVCLWWWWANQTVFWYCSVFTYLITIKNIPGPVWHLHIWRLHTVWPALEDCHLHQESEYSQLSGRP